MEQTVLPGQQKAGGTPAGGASPPQFGGGTPANAPQGSFGGGRTQFVQSRTNLNDSREGSKEKPGAAAVDETRPGGRPMPSSKGQNTLSENTLVPHQYGPSASSSSSNPKG